MKKILKVFFVAAIVAVAGYNVYQSQSVMNGMSDFALSNVEALANVESAPECSGTIYVCLSELETVKEQMLRNCSGNFSGYFSIIAEC